MNQVYLSQFVPVHLVSMHPVWHVSMYAKLIEKMVLDLAVPADLSNIHLSFTVTTQEHGCETSLKSGQRQKQRAHFCAVPVHCKIPWRCC